MTAQDYRPNQMYKIVAPGGAVHTPPEGRCWSTVEPEFLKLREAGRIYFGKDNNSQPNIIRFLDEVEGLVPWTWWPHEEVGHTDEAKKEMHGIFGKVEAFITPKPERLLYHVIHIASNPGDLVLDSFAGSWTTGAVAQKMGRRWIMVELGEHRTSAPRRAELHPRFVSARLFGHGEISPKGELSPLLTPPSSFRSTNCIWPAYCIASGRASEHT